MRDGRLVEFLGDHQIAEFPAHRLIRHAVGGHHDAGGLALGEVSPGRLAGDFGRAEHPEDVIAHLERFADQAAVAAQRLEQIIASGHRRTDLQRPAHGVVTRFARGDVEHGFQRGQGCGVVGDVGDLADGEFDPHGVVVRPGPFQRGGRHSAVAHHLLGPHQAEIGEQNRHRRAESCRRAGQTPVAVPLGEPDMRGGPATAQRGVVHDVVLQQGEGVQQVQAGAGAQRGPVGAHVGIGAAQPAQVHEGGAQALTAVEQSDEHVGGDVDTGTGQVRQCPSVDELGDVG